MSASVFAFCAFDGENLVCKFDSSNADVLELKKTVELQWSTLREVSYTMHYSLPDFPNCVLSTDVDMSNMISLAMLHRLPRVCIDIALSNEDSSSVFSSVSNGASVSVAGRGNECCEGDMLRLFGPSSGKVLLTDGWDKEVTCVGQLFQGGAPEFRNALRKMAKECFFRSFSDPDFITDYERARFFVIKSFSEDNIHKSIKYSVWASTPLGNRKLDAAYRESKDMEGICPVFLLFSVNASGQFCGVAEMIGHVDFENDADYWQQDRWSGQFLVRWGIIKDVPNNCFRHILLDNNDNKPVTHSRDSQEVKLEHGIEMLKIFKSHDLDTSLLEDFNFYDEREKSSLERKAKNRASSIGGNTEATEFINQLSDNLVEALRLDSISKKDFE